MFYFSVSLPAPGRRGCCLERWPIETRGPHRSGQVPGGVRHPDRQKTQRTPGHHGKTQGEGAMMNKQKENKDVIESYCSILYM